jgi:hypothetical protein
MEAKHGAHSVEKRRNAPSIVCGETWDFFKAIEMWIWVLGVELLLGLALSNMHVILSHLQVFKGN